MIEIFKGNLFGKTVFGGTEEFIFSAQFAANMTNLYRLVRQAQVEHEELRHENAWCSNAAIAKALLRRSESRCQINEFGCMIAGLTSLGGLYTAPTAMMDLLNSASTPIYDLASLILVTSSAMLIRNHVQRIHESRILSQHHQHMYHKFWAESKLGVTHVDQQAERLYQEL